MVAVCTAVIENGEDSSDDEILELPEINRYQPKNSAEDMNLGDTLDENQKKDLGKLVNDFNSVTPINQEQLI